MHPIRQKFVLSSIAFCYLAIIIKLFSTQIYNYPKIKKQLNSQNYKATSIKPERGKILDSSGFPLVSYQTFYQLNIYKPDLKTSPDQLVSLLSQINPQILPADTEKILKFVQNDRLKWQSLSSQFSYDQIQKITDPGITSNEIYLPHYPEGILGQLYLRETGLPFYYKRQLSGKTGFSWETKDAIGNTILTHPGWIIDAHPGLSIRTHVNRYIQNLIETTLAKGIKDFSADSGEILIIEPKTGGIIAMSAQTASSSATATSSAALTNPIITNLFEPGSIVKPLVVAAALDSESITTDYICDKCDRPIQIGQYAISNWDDSFHAKSSLKDIIKNSDNIGMSHIIRLMGYDKFSKYFSLLGFDRKTGIDLPSEARPVIKKYWPEIELATASFGQGFAVTQLQMLTAFNSLANNGYIISPHFNQQSKTSITQVYQPSTIKSVKDILKYSVENGVVAKFKPKNMEVCGKSGTSQVAVQGGYSESSTIASYIGFSPCEQPEFTMIVTIHNPRTSPWGSSTAAPIWYEIADKLPSLL